MFSDRGIMMIGLEILNQSLFLSVSVTLISFVSVGFCQSCKFINRCFNKFPATPKYWRKTLK